MRLIFIVSILAQAVTVLGNITHYIGDLPLCGVQCLVKSIEQSTCSLDNSTCICTNQKFINATTTCVAQACTVIEAFQVANISGLSCGRTVPSRQDHLISSFGLAGVALVTVALRLYSRMIVEGRPRIDDWIMVLVGLCLIVFVILGVEVTVHGFGKNVWDVGPENLTKALKAFFIDEVFYTVILGLTKISVIAFYLRIFPSSNFRRICWIIIGWILLSTTAIVLTIIFQCLPIDYNWLGWKGNVKSGRCINLNHQIYAHAALNIAQDFAVLLLPLPWLFRLQTGWKRKFNVLIMLSVGIFVCITSIIRLTKIVAFRATKNPTWDYLDTTYWTAIETYVSVIIPCLPAIRILFSKHFPKIFGIDTQSDRNTHEQSQLRSPFRPSKRSKGPANTSCNADIDGKYLSNNNIKLGDKMKGEVYTNVAGGASGSDVELVVMKAGIVISTTTMVEASLASSHSWEDESLKDAASAKHTDAV